jgi:hypothetical protein
METVTRAHLLIQLGKAALDLASKRDWRKITLKELCSHAEIPLAQCVNWAITKIQIEAELDCQLDQAMVEATPEETQAQTTRDVLFDVLMGRYDAMEEARTAWAGFLSYETSDGLSRLARRTRRLVSAQWALEAASIPTQDAKGMASVLGLARIIADTDRVWLSDDVDLSKTMAQLDKALRQAESRVTQFEAFKNVTSNWGFRRSGNTVAEAPAGASATPSD